MECRTLFHHETNFLFTNFPFLLTLIQNQLSHSPLFKVYENKQEVANIGEGFKLSNYLENNVYILLGLHKKCMCKRIILQNIVTTLKNLIL